METYGTDWLHLIRSYCLRFIVDPGEAGWCSQAIPDLRRMLQGVSFWSCGLIQLLQSITAFSVVGQSAWNDHDLPFQLCSLLVACPAKFYDHIWNRSILSVAGLVVPTSGSLLKLLHKFSEWMNSHSLCKIKIKNLMIIDNDANHEDEYKGNEDDHHADEKRWQQWRSKTWLEEVQWESECIWYFHVHEDITLLKWQLTVTKRIKQQIHYPVLVPWCDDTARIYLKPT